MGQEREIPPQIREQLIRFQQLQQALQAIVSQKQQLEVESMEIDRAISELEKVGDDAPVYKNVGAILMRADRGALLNELREKKELVSTRITILGKQEARTRERMKELQDKLQEKLRPQA